MPNERRNGVGGDGRGGNGGDTTDRVDVPRLVLGEFRVELEEICRAIARLEDDIPGVSPARRRSILYQASIRIKRLATVATGAVEMLEDHTRVLTLHLAGKKDK